MSPQVIRSSLLAMQLCVPDDWTEEQIVTFAESQNPCGTTHGWGLCQDGHASLGGTPARMNCANENGRVHVVVAA